MREFLLQPNVRLLACVDILLVLKMMTVGNYTSFLRITGKVFAAPEDYELRGVVPADAPSEAVERARRSHRNDLENIPLFFVISGLYLLTEPSHVMLAVYARGFFAARALYSVFYARSMQPHRTVAFTLGSVATFAMAASTLARLI